MKREFLLGVTLVLVVPSMVLAEGVGAEAVFQNGMGARALGMGSAFVAIADDSSAAYWNPAGLAKLKAIYLFGGFFPGGLFEQIGYQFFSASGAIGPIVAGGALVKSSIITETFSDFDSMFLGTVAVDVMGMFAVGANAKWYNHVMDGMRLNGLGYDAGFLINLGRILSLGGMAYDINNTIMAPVGDIVEARFTLGAALRLFREAVSVATDYDYFRKSVHAGLELIPTRILRGFPFQFAIRFGRVFLPGEEWQTQTMGMGLTIWNFSIDFASISYTSPLFPSQNNLIVSGEFYF